MNIEKAREYCLTFRNATESFPFDDVSLVFKVENKMFALLPLDVAEPKITLKCSPEYTEELRERYQAVEPAFHFNKKCWNSIYLEGDMQNEEIRQWIRHSFREVIAGLPKKIREYYPEEE